MHPSIVTYAPLDRHRLPDAWPAVYSRYASHRRRQGMDCKPSGTERASTGQGQRRHRERRRPVTGTVELSAALIFLQGDALRELYLFGYVHRPSAQLLRVCP